MRYPVRLLCICALVSVPLTACGTEASLCEGVECEDDGNECTEDVCDPATGTCRHVTVEDDTPCDFDGLPGSCRAGVCVDAMLCEGIECDDQNDCTEDRCNPADGECSNEPVEDGLYCDFGGGGAGGTGGMAGAGGTGGYPYMPGICLEGECVPAPEGACTNEADAAVYSALQYDTGSETLTGPEAASQIASDCVFGNQQATPTNPGCGQEAQAVLVCGGANCPDETITALTDCVLACQATVIAEATGGESLTEECSDCYGTSVTCSAVNCAAAGCTVPDSPGCIACRCENDCTPGFDRCSGLPSSGDCG